jgi:PhnB protein
VAAITPYLIVRDAEAAIAFYVAAFGATEEFRLLDKDSGKIGHADLNIGETHFMLADEHRALGPRVRPRLAARRSSCIFRSRMLMPR